MRIFKTSWFNRFARKNGITDKSLITLVKQLETGIFDVDLGAGIFKMLLAREGEGKSGGFRSLVCFKQGELAFFVYAFAKSDRQNIDQEELADLKKLAKFLFALSPSEIDKIAQSGKYIEILRNADAENL